MLNNSQTKKKVTEARASNRALAFIVPAVIWIVLDRITKFYFNHSGFHVDQLISGPYFGIFQFRLVHNRGAAWGIFSESTFALGIVSIVLCLLIILVLWLLKNELTIAEYVFLGLVLGGGIGNAIDRFANGYVVDFIETAFMQFPVFNVADMGVTCGIVLFLIVFIYREFSRDKK